MAYQIEVKARTTYQIGVKARGPAGPPGPAGTAITVPFAYGDATPAQMVTLAAGQALIAVTLVIIEPFDGIGAALEVGVVGDTDRFMSAAANLPGTAGIYISHPGALLASDTPVALSITPGAGARSGTGLLTISLQ